MYIDRLQKQQLWVSPYLTHIHPQILGIYLYLYFHHNREEDVHNWGRDEGSPLHSLLTMHIPDTCKYRICTYTHMYIAIAIALTTIVGHNVHRLRHKWKAIESD